MKAIANVERGSLQDYIGQKAINPFINKDKVLKGTIRFSIPGTQWAAIAFPWLIPTGPDYRNLRAAWRAGFAAAKAGEE